MWLRGFPSDSAVKESACNAGDLCSIPGWGRSAGGGHGNPFQYSCLENPVDSGAWQATVRRVTKSQTRLKRLILACMHGQVFCKISLSCVSLMVFVVLKLRKKKGFLSLFLIFYSTSLILALDQSYSAVVQKSVK